MSRYSKSARNPSLLRMAVILTAFIPFVLILLAPMILADSSGDEAFGVDDGMVRRIAE